MKLKADWWACKSGSVNTFKVCSASSRQLKHFLEQSEALQLRQMESRCGKISACISRFLVRRQNIPKLLFCTTRLDLRSSCCCHESGPPANILRYCLGSWYLHNVGRSFLVEQKVLKVLIGNCDKLFKNFRMHSTFLNLKILYMVYLKHPARWKKCVKIIVGFPK